MSIYRGYIYRWGIPEASKGDIVRGWENLVQDVPGMTIRERYPPAEGNSGEWLVGVFESKDAISDAHIENPTAANARGFFEYPFIFRATRQSTVIIGSSGSKVVRYFVEEFVNSRPFPELVPMRVKVNELAKHLILRDRDRYAVSSLSVNVDAAGENLERADYYGNDLAAASLIYDNLKLQTAFLIGLKNRFLGGNEMLKVGSRGYIQLSVTDTGSIPAIEEILNFLWANYYQ